MAQLLGGLSRRYQKSIEGLDRVVERAFRSYGWPGNIRELENVLERACILESGSLISPSHIPTEILDAPESHDVVAVTVESGGTLAEVRAAAVAASERRYLEGVLATHLGRIDASAAAAGITTRQLSKLLSKYGIDKAAFKRRGEGSSPSTPAAEPDG